MNKERIAELRIEALNAKYAGKEFTIPASESMEILSLAMNQLEPRVTPEMWKELGRIEAERTTAPVSLTDAQIEALAVKHESFGFGQAGKKSKLSIHGFEPEGLREFARALLAAAPAPIQQEVYAWRYRVRLGNGDWSGWRVTDKEYLAANIRRNPLYEVMNLAYPAPPAPPALAGSQVQAEGDAERYYMDHGMLHDRVTGQHLWTQDQYDEHGRDRYTQGKEDASLAEIQRGVEGLTRWLSTFDGLCQAERIDPPSDDIFVRMTSVLALLQPQGQADTSGLPG